MIFYESIFLVLRSKQSSRKQLSSLLEITQMCRLEQRVEDELNLSWRHCQPLPRLAFLLKTEKLWNCVSLISSIHHQKKREKNEKQNAKWDIKWVKIHVKALTEIHESSVMLRRTRCSNVYSTQNRQAMGFDECLRDKSDCMRNIFVFVL